mgnify:CR=1 FL=1
MHRHLLVIGTSLLLIGLLLGTILDWFSSSSVAADAHVAGVQHGMVLMILGLSWKYAHLGSAEILCSALNVLGLVGIWTAFLIGAIIGDPYPSASTVTYLMFVTSSSLLIVGVSIFLFGLYRGTDG